MTRLTLGDQYGRINRFKYMNSGLFISIEQVLSLADLKAYIEVYLFIYPYFQEMLKSMPKKFSQDPGLIPRTHKVYIHL